MMVLVLLLPLAQPTVHVVDICELNHVLQQDGTEQLVQWLWLDYDWHIQHGYGYWVRDWRMRSAVPEPINRTQEWDDRKTGRRIRVVHQVYRETWSYGDVEVSERRLLGEEDRKRFR